MNKQSQWVDKQLRKLVNWINFSLLSFQNLLVINILHIRDGQKEPLYLKLCMSKPFLIHCRFFTSSYLKLLCILYGIMSHGEFDADQTPWSLSKLSYRSRHLGGDDQGGLPTAQSDMGAMADGIHNSKHHIICICPCIPLLLYLHLTIRIFDHGPFFQLNVPNDVSHWIMGSYDSAAPPYCSI